MGQDSLGLINNPGISVMTSRYVDAPFSYIRSKETERAFLVDFADVGV